MVIHYTRRCHLYRRHRRILYFTRRTAHHAVAYRVRKTPSPPTHTGRYSRERGKTTTWQGVWEAAKDPKVWLFTLMQHFHLGANGFKNFFPTAVATLGFSETITLALTCPPYLVAGFLSIAWSWSSGRFNERTW